MTAHGQVGRLTWISDCEVALIGLACVGAVGDLDAVIGDNSVSLSGLQASGHAEAMGSACDVVLPAIAANGVTEAFTVQNSNYPDGNSVSSSIRPAGVAGSGRANAVYILGSEVLIVVLA